LPHRWRRATVAALSLVVLFGCTKP